MSDNDKRNKALLTGTITYAIGSFGTKFLNFLIIPLYTYYISPSDLGDYDLLVTTVSLLSPLITMKISDATYRWIIREKENEVPYISATYKLLFRNCLFACILLLSINFFVPVWNCYYFIAILIGDRVLECLQKILRGLKNQKLFAISGILHTAILVTLNVIKICVFKEGVIALLQSSVISLYCTIIFILIFEKRLRDVNLRVNYKNQQKEMLKYSIPLVPTTLSWWVMSASDRYAIRFFIGSTANGIYSVASKFPSVLQLIFTMFNNAWIDTALAQIDNSDKGSNYINTIFKTLYKVSFGAAFVLIPLSKVVMVVAMSEAYKEAATCVGFLYLGSVFQGLSAFCNIGYLRGKKTVGAATTSMAGATVNLGIDLILINFIGIYAAAISTFLGFFVMWIFRFVSMRKTFPIKLDTLHFGIYLLVDILLAICSIWTSIYVDCVISAIALVFFLIDNRHILKKVTQMFFRFRGTKSNVNT